MNVPCMGPSKLNPNRSPIKILCDALLVLIIQGPLTAARDYKAESNGFKSVAIVMNEKQNKTSCMQNMDRTKSGYGHASVTTDNLPELYKLAI